MAWQRCRKTLPFYIWTDLYKSQTHVQSYKNKTQLRIQNLVKHQRGSF